MESKLKYKPESKGLREKGSTALKILIAVAIVLMIIGLALMIGGGVSEIYVLLGVGVALSFVVTPIILFAGFFVIERKNIYKHK